RSETVIASCTGEEVGPAYKRRTFDAGYFVQSALHLLHYLYRTIERSTNRQLYVRKDDPTILVRNKTRGGSRRSPVYTHNRENEKQRCYPLVTVEKAKTVHIALRCRLETSIKSLEEPLHETFTHTILMGRFEEQSAERRA